MNNTTTISHTLGDPYYTRLYISTFFFHSTLEYRRTLHKLPQPTVFHVVRAGYWV